tara:strand:+ start:21688 stop:22152 length:465 start_codon:yes stop_codon:yes gene_type:complete
MEEVKLIPIKDNEYDVLFEMMHQYFLEINSFESNPVDINVYFDLYWPALFEDIEYRELLWIIHNKKKVGFTVIRILPDWPDDTKTIASIAEFYVQPDSRRSGIGTTAINLLLSDHRHRKTSLIEADILVNNQPAIKFWQSLGFEVQYLQTGRKP